MATTPVIFAAPTGKTLTVDLFPRTSDTAAASALVVTEKTNAKTIYGFNVTAALTGVHKVIVKESAVAIGSYWVDLNDTTTQHEADDDLFALLLDSSTIATAVAAELLANRQQIADALFSGRSDTRGDTWQQAFVLSGDRTGSTDWLFSLKAAIADSDNSAELRVTKIVGLDRINAQDAATAGLVVTDASIATVYAAGPNETTVTVTVESAATAMIDADDSSDTTTPEIYPNPRTAASLRIYKKDYYFDLQEYDGTVDETRDNGEFRVYADVSQATN